MKNTLKITLTQRFAFWQAVLFLVGIASFSSCKDDNLVGIEAQPSGEFDDLASADTFTVLTTTRISDPIASLNNQSYIGTINNTEFGTTTSNMAFDFVIGSVSPPSDYDNYSIDSVVLHLRPTGYYGNFDEGAEVEIFRLEEPLDLDAYTSDFEPIIGANALASFNLSLSSGVIDSLPRITFNGDTTREEAFSYRIPLPVKIGEEFKNWFKDSDPDLAFNGLYLRVKDENGTLPGAIYQFSLLSPESRLRLYLTNYEDTTQTQTVATFAIGSNVKRVGVYRHDFTDSDAEAALNSSDVSDQKVYLSGLSGTKGEVKIPGLSTYADGRSLAVARAVLTIPVDTSQTDLFKSYGRIYFLDDDPEGESFTLDFITNRNRHNGVFDATTGDYSFDITRSVQKIFDQSNSGVDVNYGFTLNTEVPVENGNSLSQIVLMGSDSAQLEIYYSDITD